MIEAFVSFAAEARYTALESMPAPQLRRLLGCYAAMHRAFWESERFEPGDELRYTITFLNAGSMAVDAGSIVITNPLPDNTEYLEGTASGPNTVVVFSVDGEHFAPDDALTVGGRTGIAAASDYRAIRWTFGSELGPGESSFVTFDVRLK